MKRKILISLILCLAIFLLIGLITNVEAATDVETFVNDFKLAAGIDFTDQANNDTIIEGGEYKGKLLLTFSVDSKYEGKTIKIYHKLKSGKIEKRSNS